MIPCTHLDWHISDTIVHHNCKTNDATPHGLHWNVVRYWKFFDGMALPMHFPKKGKCIVFAVFEHGSYHWESYVTGTPDSCIAWGGFHLHIYVFFLRFHAGMILCTVIMCQPQRTCGFVTFSLHQSCPVKQMPQTVWGQVHIPIHIRITLIW